MLTTNDAYLYKFQVTIKALEMKARPQNAMSVKWFKDDKEAETDKSSVVIDNQVLFKSNVLIINLTLNKDKNDKFKNKTTTFAVYEHDGVGIKEIGSSKFRVNQILHTKLSSYTLQITNQSSVKAHLTFTISQKFVTKVSQFRFNKQPQASESEQSSVYFYEPPFETSIPKVSLVGSRKVSIDFDEIKSQKMIRDEVDTLYQENKRLKTDHDKLAIKTKEAVAKTKRGEKAVWWQFKQISDFYNRKLNIHRKVYEDNIEKIVFETNQAKDRLNQIIDEQRQRIQLVKEKQRVGVNELSKVKEQLMVSRSEVQNMRIKERERYGLEVERVEENQRSLELVRKYQIRIRQLQGQRGEKVAIIEEYLREIKCKDVEIERLNTFNSEINKNSSQGEEVMRKRVQELERGMAAKDNSHQEMIDKIDSQLDKAGIKYTTQQTVGKIGKLVESYNKQLQKINTLQQQVFSTSNNPSLQQQLKLLQQSVTQKDKLLTNLKQKDEAGHKSIQQLQSLLDFHQKSSELYSNKLQKQMNESEILRKHLRSKELEIIKKDETIQQLQSHLKQLESELFELNNEMDNLQQRNLHLEEVVKSMDGIVSTKIGGNSNQLVTQLHEEIDKKNHIIIGHERRYNRFIERLEGLGEARVEVNKILEIYLDQEMQDHNVFAKVARVIVSEVRSLDNSYVSEQQNQKSQQQRQVDTVDQQWQQGLETLYYKLTQYLQKIIRCQERVRYLPLPTDQRSDLLNTLDQKQLSHLCSQFQHIKKQITTSMVSIEYHALEVQEENKSLKEQIQQISKEVEELLEGKRGIKPKRKEIDSESINITVLNGELSAKQNKIREGELKLDYALKQCQRLLDLNKILDQQHHSEILQKERVIQRQQNEINENKRELQIRYNQFTMLQNHLGNIQSNYQELTQRFVSVNNQHCELIRRFNQLDYEFKKGSEENSKVIEKHRVRETVLEGEIQELRKESSKTRVELSLLTEEMSEKTHVHLKEIEGFRTKVQEMEQELKLQYRYLEESKRVEENNEAKVKSLESRIRSMVNEEQHKRQIAQSKTHSLSKEINLTKEQKKQLEEQLKLLKTKIAQESEKRYQIEKQCSETKSKYKEMTQLYEICQRQLKVKLSDVEELLDEVKTMKAGIEMKKNENRMLADQVKRLEEEMEELRKKDGVYQQRILQSNKEVELSRGEETHLRKQIERWEVESRQTKQEFQQQMRAMATRLQEKEIQVTQLNLYIQQLKRSVDLQIKSHQKLLSKQLLDSQIQLKNYQQQISEFVQKQLSLTRLMEAKTQQIQMNKQQILHLSVHLKNKQMQCQRHFKQNSYNLALIKQLKESERNNVVEINDCKQVIESLRIKEFQLFQELGNQNDKVMSIKGMLENQTRLEIENKKAINELNQRVGKLEKELSIKESQLKVREESYRRNTTQLTNQYESKLKLSESKHTKYQQEHSISNEQFERVTKENRVAKQNNQMLMEKLKKAEKEYKLRIDEINQRYKREQEQKNGVIDVEVSGMAVEIDELKRQIQRWRSQNHSVVQENTSLKLLNESLSTQHEQRGRSWELELAQQKDRVTTTLSETKHLHQQIQDRQRQLLHSRQIAKQSQRKADELILVIKQLEHVSDQKRELKNEYQRVTKDLDKVRQENIRLKHNSTLAEQSVSERVGGLESKYKRELGQLEKEVKRQREEIEYYMVLNEEKEEYIQTLVRRVDEYQMVVRNGGKKQGGEHRRTETVPSLQY